MTFLSDKSNIQVVDEPVYKSELVGGSPVSTAGGTPNRYSKFTSPTVIGDGLLSDDGVTITTYADIVPDIDNTRSLGSPTFGYSNLYLASNIHYASNLLFKSGGVQKLSLDTSGFMLFNNNQGLDVIGTGGVDVLNIGTANADTINIGWSGANVNIMGNTFYENVTQLQVADKLFTVNKGGAVASGNSAGFEIEEGGIITGQFSTNGTRDGWLFLAPAIASSATLSLANLLANRTYTLQNASGTLTLGTGVAGRATFWNGANQVQGSAVAIANEGSSRWEFQALGLTSTGASGTTVNYRITNDGFSTDIALMQRVGNASALGNYTGTTIAQPDTMLLQNSNLAGSTGGAPVVIKGTPIYHLIGQTATNFGSRQDATGFRIDQIQNLQTANIAPFEVFHPNTTIGSIFRNGASSRTIIGQVTGTLADTAIYMFNDTATAPTATNYVLAKLSGNSGNIFLNGNAVAIQTNATNRILMTSNRITIQALNSGSGASVPTYDFLNAGIAGSTAGGEGINFNVRANTRDWLAGNIALNRSFFIGQSTYSFGNPASSTITDAVTFEIAGAPIAGLNAIFTRSWGARIFGTVAFGSSVFVGDSAGQTVPTAFVDIIGSTLGRASFRMRAGVAVGAPNSGEFYFDGTNVFFNNGATAQMGRVLTGTAVLDFPNTLTLTSSELTITVVGASVGDAVSLGLPSAPNANSCFTAYVSAVDTVTVRFNNYSALAIDPASGTYKVVVIKN